MATINRQLAEKLIQGNGKCKEGSAGYCLVRYQNRTKYDIQGVDFYDPDAKINCFDYAIFSGRRKYEGFLDSPTVGGVEVLWGSARFYKDEVKRQKDEIKLELKEEFAGLAADYAEADEEMLNEEKKTIPKRRSKER